MAFEDVIVRRVVKKAESALDAAEGVLSISRKGRPELDEKQQEQQERSDPVEEKPRSNYMVRHQLARADIETLCHKALTEGFPRDRPLKDWEPERLNETHLQMVLMRAQGMRQRIIARILGVTDSNVSIVLNHPDAQFLLARLVSHAASDVIDLNERLKAIAPEMFEIAVEAAYAAEKPKDRAKIAFGFLDRAGYSVKKEMKHRHEIMVPQEQANLLSSALEESREIQEADYVIIDEKEEEGE